MTSAYVAQVSNGFGLNCFDPQVKSASEGLDPIFFGVFRKSTVGVDYRSREMSASDRKADGRSGDVGWLSR